VHDSVLSGQSAMVVQAERHHPSTAQYDWCSNRSAQSALEVHRAVHIGNTHVSSGLQNESS
jgi:hypothetical protein